MKEGIFVKGVDNLSEEHKKIVDKLSDEYYKKIQRQLKNTTILEIHIKNYENAGGANKEKKFSIHIRAVAPTKTFEGDASDWDFARTLHKSLNKVINEIEHKFHPSEQHDGIRRPQKKRTRKN